MQVLSLIVLAIIIIALFVRNKYNQKRIKTKEAEERILSLMIKVNDFKDIMKKVKDNASDAINASEAKSKAESVIRDINSVNFGLDKVEKALQEFKGKSLHANDVDERIINLDTQIKDISKKVVAAKKEASEAIKIKIAQMSRVPYTIQNIPFLTSKFIADYSQRLYVKYSISDSTDQMFPVIRAPRKGCEIKFPVVGRKNNRGASEQSFCNKIVECGLQSKFYDNLSLFYASLNYPYEPDLAYIDVNKGIFLDIEIDEPYAGWDRIPIHYKINECTIDDTRNEHFTERGWCVIRFSEKQIHNEPLSCLKKIFELLHKMDATISIPSFLLKEPDVKKEDWWSKSDAERMEKNKEREKHLNISSFNPPVTKDDIQIKDYEQGHLVEAKIIKDKDQKCWDECIRCNDLSTYKIKFPKGIHANEVPQKEEDILWNECDRTKDYLTYVRKSKLKTYLALAQEKLRQKGIEENNGKNDELDAQRYERQVITTTSTPTRTPSSRGYA